MRIPRFWTSAEGPATDPSGRRYHLRIWGWSHESAADALATARRRLSDAAFRIASGVKGDAYFYGRAPLREEIVRLLGESEAGAEAVVTRNRYGALVLNTARVPFIDVDAPPDGAASALKRLFSRQAAPDPALERIRQACQLNSRYVFRLYRTHAGYRLLVSNAPLDPRSDSTQALLASFGADKAFVTLCRAQGSFRARLTPKPWRCDCPAPPGQFPREDQAQRERFAEWLAAYEKASAPYATCKYLETIGAGLPSSDSRVVIDEHDRATRALDDRPLA